MFSVVPRALWVVMQRGTVEENPHFLGCINFHLVLIDPFCDFMIMEASWRQNKGKHLSSGLQNHHNSLTVLLGDRIEGVKYVYVPAFSLFNGNTPPHTF